MNTKHLVRIELHTREPTGAWHPSGLRAFGLSLVAPHPRARVDLEERHRQLPAWSIRFLYRRILLPVIAPLMAPEARGRGRCQAGRGTAGARPGVRPR
jgi:hypothetical protein